MANRFLDNNYYKSPFVRGLKGALKSLYSFIICDCTPSGVWAMDMEAASLYIGFGVSSLEFDESFVAAGKAIKVSTGKFFFPDFIEHQYPGGLQDDNKAHKNIILELKKYDFLREEIVSKVIKNETKNVSVFYLKNKGALKGHQSPPMGGQGIGQGNGNGVGDGIGQGNTYPNQEKFIVPRMCKVWYENFKTYTSDKLSDSEGMGKILQFITRQASVKNIEDLETQGKILNTIQQIADEVNKDIFWINKPLKSIANNIQEFYNKIKNPVNGKSGIKNRNIRTEVQAELEKRIAERG